MKRTEKRLTDDECRELLTEIVKIVITAYRNIRPEFEKKSRMDQIGYDTVYTLYGRGIIAKGENGQERFDI